MLTSCSYALPLARTLSWCSVCATAHLPNVVLVGACGPALSELVGSSENWQFSGLREGVLGLVRYVRPEYERTQAEICGFLACLSQRLRDAVLRIVLTLVRTNDDCVLSFSFFN